MTDEEIKQLVHAALAEFLRLDSYLLRNDLSERCIAARVAFHLQALLADVPELFVDVEYNRKGIDPKRFKLPEFCLNKPDQYGNVLAIPDLIVHSRGIDGPNVLVLEFKKTTNPISHDCDRQRLRAFREKLHYQLGGLVECETRPGREAAISVIEWT